MNKGRLLLVSGFVLAVGAIAAVAAPPRGLSDDIWGQPGMGMPGMDRMRRGGGTANQGMMPGWPGPRSITADEYDARTRERFARIDKNGDGFLDADEIEVAVEVHGRFARGRGQSAARGAGWRRGEPLLQRFGDKDGRLTKDAYLNEAKRRFAELDLNSDGKITDDDLPPMMRGKGILQANSPEMPGTRSRGLMRLRAADVKGDGVITLDAVLALETKRFEGLDRNKDGVVDKADFDAARKEMAAYAVKRFLHAYGADAEGKVTKDQFYKVAKERFARLDRKGEGRITIGSDYDGDRGGRRRGWPDVHRHSGPMEPDRAAPTPPAKQ